MSCIAERRYRFCRVPNNRLRAIIRNIIVRSEGSEFYSLSLRGISHDYHKVPLIEHRLESRWREKPIEELDIA